MTRTSRAERHLLTEPSFYNNSFNLGHKTYLPNLIRNQYVLNLQDKDQRRIYTDARIISMIPYTPMCMLTIPLAHPNISS